MTTKTIQSEETKKKKEYIKQLGIENKKAVRNIIEKEAIVLKQKSKVKTWESKERTKMGKGMTLVATTIYNKYRVVWTYIVAEDIVIPLITIPKLIRESIPQPSWVNGIVDKVEGTNNHYTIRSYHKIPREYW